MSQKKFISMFGSGEWDICPSIHDGITTYILSYKVNDGMEKIVVQNNEIENVITAFEEHEEIKSIKLCEIVMGKTMFDSMFESGDWLIQEAREGDKKICMLTYTIGGNVQSKQLGPFDMIDDIYEQLESLI